MKEIKKNTLVSLHRENNLLYFLLNERLMIVDASTSRFNDYGEWRINEITYVKEKYVEKDNDVGITLKPLKSFKPIELTEKEVEYLEHYFLTLEEDEEYEEKYNPCLYSYMGDYLLISGFVKGELVHSINKYTGKKSNNGEDIVELDYQVKEEEWFNKKDIMHYQGIYNLFIPMMSAFVSSVLEEED